MEAQNPPHILPALSLRGGEQRGMAPWGEGLTTGEQMGPMNQPNASKRRDVEAETVRSCPGRGDHRGWKWGFSVWEVRGQTPRERPRGWGGVTKQDQGPPVPVPCVQHEFCILVEMLLSL